MVYTSPNPAPVSFFSIQRGVSTLILAVYSAMHAALLLLLVRTAGKHALTSCS